MIKGHKKWANTVLMILPCVLLFPPRVVQAAAEHTYVRANQPTAANYVPGTTLTGRIGSNEAPEVRVQRNGVGQYTVSFGGAVLASAGGNVQVSANSNDGEYCKVQSWGGGGAEVRCYSTSGRPADAAFSMLATRVNGRTPGIGYAWINAKSLTRVSPDYSYAEDGAVTVRRESPGVFRVSLPGTIAAGGNVQVTAYGSDSNYCNVRSWNSNSAYVLCFNPDGQPVDASFSMLATDSRYRPAYGRMSFIWANQPTEASYSPAAGYAKAESIDPIVRRRSQGFYQVTLGPIVSAGGTAHVTTYSSASRCEPAGWAGNSVMVRCRAASGVPVDARFALLAMRSGPTQIIDEFLPVGHEPPVAVETNTIRQRINVVEHLCINSTCEFGDGSWDKSTREKRYDGTDTTTFKVDVEGSRLIRLCPVRRNTTDREFDGNGPAVRASSTVSRDGRTLNLSAFMEARETGSGSSLAFKTWDGVLYTAPPGWRISQFDPISSETSYTDRNHAEDVPAVRGGSLVSEFRFKGDTNGSDTGDCTPDDTYMTIAYNPVTVTLSALRSDLREVRFRQHEWTILLEAFVTGLSLQINNYDRTKSQPENGTERNRYYINRTDTTGWSALTDDEIRQGSFYEYQSPDPGSPSVPPTPLPIPSIESDPFTFLLNSLVADGRRNRVAPAGDHIRLTIPFESAEPEVVGACVNHTACGSGEPHESGKPLVQVNDLRLIPYLRLEIDHSSGQALTRVAVPRIRLEAEITRDGVCRENLFAFACGMFAGDIERLTYENTLVQIDSFVKNNASLLGLLNRQFDAGICQLLELRDENCRRLDNIVLDENGDMLLWMRN
jgi:hypothetical protein